MGRSLSLQPQRESIYLFPATPAAPPRPSTERSGIHIGVNGTDAALNLREFAHFLYLFRAAYARSLDFGGIAEALASNPGPSVDRFTSGFYANTAPLQIANLFNTDLEDDELGILNLSKNSPLEMVVAGSIAALVIATIVSGGKVEFKPLPKFTLPPLGVGIKSLREAFRLPPNKTRKRRLK